jgi:hypothetical protein
VKRADHVSQVRLLSQKWWKWICSCVVLMKHHDLTTYWGVEVKLHHSYPRLLVETSSGLSAIARFIPEERVLDAHWIWFWVGPIADLDAIEKRNTLAHSGNRTYRTYQTQRCYGRAIAEAVSRWLPTAAARVQSRVWSSGICGGQSGIGAGFLRVLRFPLPFIPPNSLSSQSPGAGTIGQWVADVPSGPSLDSTPRYAN